jgi:ABC-type branched-subunit amino acid transport system substrate-binding protein
MNDTRTTNRRTAKVVAAAALLCAAPALTACGGSSGGATPASGGDTIKVLAYGPFDAKGFSLPSIKTGAEAGVAKVNAAGGINGRKLELITCNDNNDPNTAAGCARTAVQEKVVAVVGGISTFEPQILPVLEKAGIPVIGTTAVSNFTSPVTYPFTGAAAGALFGLGKAMATNPVCKGKVGGVIESFAATEGAMKLFQLGVQASGATYTGTSKAPQGARDFAPAVGAAADKTGCLGMLAGPQTAPVIVTAAAQNPKVTLFGTADTALPSGSVKALGAAADGVIVVSNYLPFAPETNTPAMKEFLAAGKKLDPKFDPDQGAASAYLAPQVLKKALEGTTDITTASVTTGLNKIKGYDTGLGPVLDFTVPNPAKSFARLPLKSPLYQLVAKDGAYTLATDKTLDVSAIYQAAAKAGQ